MCMESLFRRRRQVVDFKLYQIRRKKGRHKKRMITGTLPGATSTFQIGTVPSSNVVPLESGPSVTVDVNDSNVTLTQPGPNGQFTATVSASPTETSYNLTVTGVNGAGVTITRTFNVPILAVPAQQITDFTLDQLS